MGRKGADEESEALRFVRSRRALLAGAAGGLGLLAGETVLAAKPARAANGDNVVLGATNQESSATGIVNGAGTGSALVLISSTSAGDATLDATNLGGTGAAVYAASALGEGLYARSGSKDGSSPTGTRSGVHGVTDGLSDSAVWGEAVSGGVGVKGTTNSAADGGSAAVSGLNLGAGPGIVGSSQGGFGVQGTTILSGAGVLAQGLGGGAAGLQVVGPSVFNRSGTVSISGMNRSATVTVPGGLTSAALVLAMLQNSLAGLWVVSAVPNASAGTVTISLNQAPGGLNAAKVAWFVVN